MTTDQGGNATGPPRIRRAIIGATLLLKGDVPAPWQSAPQPGETPDLAQAKHGGGELPSARFGQPVRLILPQATSGPPALAAAPALATLTLAQPAPTPPSVKTGKAASLGALARALAATEPRRVPAPPVPRRARERPHGTFLPPDRPAGLTPPSANEAGIAEASTAPEPLPQPAFGGGATEPDRTAQPAPDASAVPAMAAGPQPPLAEAAPNTDMQLAAEPDFAATGSGADPALPAADPTNTATGTGTEIEAPPDADSAPAAATLTNSSPGPVAASAPGEVQADAEMPEPQFGPSAVSVLPTGNAARQAVADPPSSAAAAQTEAPDMAAAAANSTIVQPAVEAELGSGDAAPADTALGTSALPQPAFGQGAGPGAPSPTVRATLAYAEPAADEALPQPRFGQPAKAPQTDEKSELAAARTSAIPSLQPGPGPAQPQASTAYADTSPRIGRSEEHTSELQSQ